MKHELFILIKEFFPFFIYIFLFNENLINSGMFLLKYNLYKLILFYFIEEVMKELSSILNKLVIFVLNL